MVENDIGMAFDAVRFAARAGIELDRWQEEVMRFCGPQLILNCHRQSGKSTVVALKAAHVALYGDRALVLLLSPSLQSVQGTLQESGGCIPGSWACGCARCRQQARA
jgi:hypothetical protein